MKIQLIVDGQLVQVDKGTPIINAAKKAGIHIPALCHHDRLMPHGACRICMVEVVQNKRRKLVTSCNFPAGTGMEVFTDTPKVREIRRNVVELLLARCSEAPIVQTLAKRMGVETLKYKKKELKECILCGLCVRFCEEVVGASAIGLSNRGTESEVTTPFKGASETCIGCGSCTYICPTGCIEMVNTKTQGARVMNMGKLSLEPCPHDYQCETCDIDAQFMEKTKQVITQFRKKVYNTADLPAGKKEKITHDE
ncbi:MAG: 2Fe-2S iron-sulfur cluster-binding protein [Candidatus Mariimomonas ferrooxydans]